MRWNKKLLIGLTVFLITVFPTVNSVTACTIFTASDGQTVLFGGNEDNKEAFQWRIGFFPARNGKYGTVLLGWRISTNTIDLFNPMAGLNDQGLAIDLNEVPYTPLALDPEREDYQGSLWLKWLDECATVAEVKESLNSFNMLFLEEHPDQIHIADKTGDAMVVGLDLNGEAYMTNKTGNYLVSTNFNLAQVPGELRNGWRYEKATTALDHIDQNGILSVDGCRNILKETALYPGYSFIVNLTNGLIYLYSHNDFNRVAVLDIQAELAKGAHSYAIETLVTQETGKIREPILNSVILSVFIVLGIISLSSAICFLKWKSQFKSELVNDHPDQERGFPLSNSLNTSHLAFRFFLCLILISGLFIIFKSFLKLGPFYTSDYATDATWTNIFYIHFTALLFFIIGINFRPWITIMLASLAILIGEVGYCIWSGYGGELWIQLIFSLMALAGAALVTSIFREKNEILALVFGVLWTFIGFYIPGSYYYNSVCDLGDSNVFILTLISSTINLAFIPLVLILNKIFRFLIKARYLEDFLFERKETAPP
ncbi:MAG: hypothetical protein ACXAB4_03760 [Candidatus Hodarchaeales archaeon]|jgi:hypothetical protein